MFDLLLLCHAALAAAAHQKPLGAGTHPPVQRIHFDPLLHLPGISPYFDAYGFGLEDKPPLGCNVTAASYLVRHAAIYANDHDYDTYMAPFIKKLDAHRDGWTGPLAVLTNWTSPYTDPKHQMEMITPSGADDALAVAKNLLSRYPDLVPTTTKVYSDKKPRTHDTAAAFIRAFPQRGIELVTITDDSDQRAAIPHKSCPAFSKTAGDAQLAAFQAEYTKGTLARLQRHAPVRLTPDDVMGMQQLCGYESAISGAASALCAAFTQTEWLAYEYAWDVKYAYMVGPGNPLSSVLGFPWLNVTASLFRTFHDGGGAAADPQRFFATFTHREVPPFLATALGLFNSSSPAAEAFPTSRINFARSWRMAELIPFLGHIGIEALACGPESGARHGSRFVRVLANSAPRPIPACQQGPGASCSFHDFQELVARGMDEYGDFDGACRKKGGKGEEGGVGWA